MFERFKKNKKLKKNNQDLVDLECEYKQEVSKFALYGDSETYKFFTEYFEAKGEINRDKIEILNPLKDAGEIIKLCAANEVMRDFIDEIKNMKEFVDG